MAKPAVKTSEKAAVSGAGARISRRPPEPRRGGLTAGVIFTTAIVLLAAFAMPTCVLLVIGMFPTGAAWLMDNEDRRLLTLTIGGFNAAGAAPFFCRLWFGAPGMEGVLHLVANPITWILIYLAAGLGWVAYQAMPYLVKIALERTLHGRQAGLLSFHRSLRDEWGDEVGQGDELE